MLLFLSFFAVIYPFLQLPVDSSTLHKALASRKRIWEKHFSLRRVERAQALHEGSLVSSSSASSSEYDMPTWRDMEAAKAKKAAEIGVVRLSEDVAGGQDLTSKGIGSSLVSSLAPAPKTFAVPKRVLTLRLGAASSAGPVLDLARSEGTAKGGEGQKRDRSRGRKPNVSDKGEDAAEERLTKKQRCKVVDRLVVVDTTPSTGDGICKSRSSTAPSFQGDLRWDDGDSPKYYGA